MMSVISLWRLDSSRQRIVIPVHDRTLEDLIHIKLLSLCKNIWPLTPQTESFTILCLKD